MVRRQVGREDADAIVVGAGLMGAAAAWSLAQRKLSVMLLEHFILDRVGTLVICSPCSGHGAKLAPLIGELAADLATSPAGARIPERFRIAALRGS